MLLNAVWLYSTVNIVNIEINTEQTAQIHVCRDADLLGRYWGRVFTVKSVDELLHEFMQLAEHNITESYCRLAPNGWLLTALLMQLGQHFLNQHLR
ncbi:MAG: hypothetical protein JW841_02300 [Deltaproteobacteria bacterium]|nr:hypothetical protein [Deltaproteobacteria bacterium]